MIDYNDMRFIDLEPYPDIDAACAAAAAFPCGVGGCDGVGHEALDVMRDWKHRTAVHRYAPEGVHCLHTLRVETWLEPDGTQLSYAVLEFEAEMPSQELLELAGQLALAADWLRTVAAAEVR